jgi:hypothetical protein
MNGHEEGDSSPSDRRTMRRPILILAVACLVIATISEASSVIGNLGRWLTDASRCRPYQLRLRTTDWFLSAVLGAQKTSGQTDMSTPILIDGRSTLNWAFALRLQPRPVYFDREVVRQRFTTERTPFLVAHLGPDGRSADPWFERFDAAGRRIGAVGRSPAVFADGFENTLDNWSDAESPMDD